MNQLLATARCLVSELSSENISNEKSGHMRSALAVALLLFGWHSTACASDSDELCPDPIRMAHSGDYAPYQYTDKKGQLVGLDVDIARLITVRMGCDLEVIRLPPKRAQKMLAEGAIDAMAAASVTPAREVYAYFSTPYRGETIVMFVRRDKYHEYHSYDLLSLIHKNKRITAGLGGWYGPQWSVAKEHAENRNLLALTNSTAGQINMLLKKRVDIAIADRFVGYHHASQLDKAGYILELPTPLNDDPAHFMFSRKSMSEDFIKEFNKALQWLKKSNAYKATIDRYIAN